MVIYSGLLLILALVLFYLSSLSPALTEGFFSQGLYQLIIPTFSRVTGVFPFSLAELIILSIVVFFTLKLLGFIGGLGSLPVKLIVKKALILGGVVYFLFISTWGLNYNRYTFGEIAGLDIEPATVVELEALAQELIAKSNGLRLEVLEDGQGVMGLNGDIGEMFARADRGFTLAGQLYPALAGEYGPPKGVYFSQVMAYLGIGGFYFPFTAEANVNTTLPHSMLPFVTTHEMAHQRGFAREDEANFIAYLTATRHPDPDFQYSGNLMALVHTMRALKTLDPNLALSLEEGYSPGVQRDLEAIRQYWAKYDGPLDRISSSINNLFLKANGQQDGVASYGRMIDLLLAQYR